MRPSPFLLLLCSLAPSIAAQGFDPADAIDINPDPNILEVNLQASVTTWQFLPGVDTTVWAYNDQVPGPTLRAKLGDLLRVHFTNNLLETTTIHWHGVETTAAMDGSHIAQAHIKPGETFTYEFPLLRAGLYWYHPHVRTFDQVELGLHGALLVTDELLEQTLGVDQIEQHIVVFDDILLDANNEIVPAFSFADPLQNAIYHVNGREGNVLLVNGRQADSVRLPVANGEPQRWRVVNVANTTFCRLDVNDAVEGFSGQLWELGVDGGFEEHPYARLPVVPFTPVEHPTFSLLGPMNEGILLMPGERLDVVFTPQGNDGQVFRMFQHDWIRGRHIANYGPNNEVLLSDDPNDGFNPKQPFFEVELVGPDPGLGEYVPPPVLTKIGDPRPEPSGVLPVTFGHANPDLAGNVTFFAQADFSSGSMVPLPTPKIDSFNAHDVNTGEVWTWEITNLTHGDHPFHVHGFSFIPLQYEFQDDLDPNGNFFFIAGRKMIKDTVRCPARGAAKGTTRTITRLLTYFDDRGREGQVKAQGQTATYDPSGNWTSGGWLFHCHVLEHSGKGMLSWFEVHDPDETTTLLGKSLPGTLGKPSLTTRGPQGMGQVLHVDLANAPAGLPVTLVVGFQPTLFPFRGGTLVPAAEIVLPGTTNMMGVATWSASGWEGYAPGTTFYMQAGFLDAGAPQGVALSNALVFTRP